MKTQDELRTLLTRIDGRGYKAYKDLRGAYDCDAFICFVDHVQGDPFAAPSRVRIRVPQTRAAFPDDTFDTPCRSVALRDFLARRCYNAIRARPNTNRGSGKSGLIAIDPPGQEILERSSVIISSECVEVRIRMGLPAFGRRVAGHQANQMFFDDLPRLVEQTLRFTALDQKACYHHLATAEDADALRAQLPKHGCIAFVADGAILPRASGVDDRPLTGSTVIPFSSPDSLRLTVTLPHAGAVTGMGLPSGVTLIVGGGYHGKSTLLTALEHGIYNHIPGDGREQVVTDDATVKIRAEDGRRIEKVCISPFISDLPFGTSTEAFSSDDASGSTSQAATIIEALEVGARVLLMDEDTSATSFMIRDHRMQELVTKDREPITPFIDKVRQLCTEHDVSTLLVIGGSGDYFDVADRVLCMVDYRPEDVTERALAIAESYRAERQHEGGSSFGTQTERIPDPTSIDPKKGRHAAKIADRGTNGIAFGTHHIDLGAVEQLVDPAQTRAIGDAIHYATRYMRENRTLAEIARQVSEDIGRQGLDVLSTLPVGDYAEFRRFEFAAALNRLRTLRVRQSSVSEPPARACPP